MSTVILEPPHVLAVSAGGYDCDGFHVDQRLTAVQTAILRRAMELGGIDSNRCFSAYLGEGVVWFDCHLPSHPGVRYGQCWGAQTFITIRRRVDLRNTQ
jgi:hypothetical protein